MVKAIGSISVAKGCDPRDYVLVPFGGAAGQHACAVARELGMRQILHPSRRRAAERLRHRPGRRRAAPRDGRLSTAIADAALGRARTGLRSDWPTRRVDERAGRRHQPRDDRDPPLARAALSGRRRLADHPLPRRTARRELCRRPSPPSTASCTATCTKVAQLEIVAARIEARGPLGRRCRIAGAVAEPTRRRPSGGPSNLLRRPSCSTTEVSTRGSLRPGDRFVGPAIVCEDGLDHGHRSRLAGRGAEPAASCW